MQVYISFHARLRANMHNMNLFCAFKLPVFAGVLRSFRFLPAFVLLFPAGLSAQSLEWANHAGGADFEEARDLAVDAAGNVFIIGTFAGTTDFGTGGISNKLNSAGGLDVYFAKYDATGKNIWAKRIGGAGPDAGYDIALDADGHVYITGNFTGTADFDPGPGLKNLSSNGSFDIFLAKYDASGALLWANNTGGTLFEESVCMASDALGNVTIAGNFFGTVDFDPGPGTAELQAPAGNPDMYFARYDAAGGLLWVKQLHGNGSNRVIDLALDEHSNIYITGQFENSADFDPSDVVRNLNSAGSFDIFFARYDDAGKLVWAGHAGGPNYDDGKGIALDSAGNVYVTGRFNDTADFDPGAGVHTLTTVDFTDAFFAKYDPAGDLVWAKSVGGTLADQGTGIAVDAPGNVYLIGQFQGIADLDPSGAVEELISAGDFDIFLAQYDPLGNLITARNPGGNKMDEGFAIAIDGAQHVYVAGLFKGTADFDPGSAAGSLTSAGEEDMFIVKYKTATTAIHQPGLLQVRVYPVPATDALYLELPEEAGNAHISIFDGSGRLLNSRDNRISGDSIPLNGMDSGSYYLLIETAAGARVVTFQVLK